MKTKSKNVPPLKIKTSKYSMLQPGARGLNLLEGAE
jgi:hypothetical protein